MSERELRPVVEAMLASYRNDARGHHIGRRFLPSRDEIIEAVSLLLQLMYPGYFGRQDLTEANIDGHVTDLVRTLRSLLVRQIEQCLCFAQECTEARTVAGCSPRAAELADALLAKLPEIRAVLLDDVSAAYDGDPAATSIDEVILAYPGLLAITVHRVAHELYVAGVPIMPRIMSEWAHTQTGADMHPGATVGRRFFIDHATGVVLGETSHIGRNVKLYQGVTLGALSLPKDERGRAIRNAKRHPTVEDDVTLYANAIVLGGDTVVGAGTTVGGSVFLTKSVPRGSKVAMRPPELNVRGGEAPEIDFEI